MLKRLSLVTVAVLLLGTGTAFGQSAGAGGGAFSNAYLIPTIVCEAGFGTNIAPTCPEVVGPKVLYSTFKVPSASNKNVLLMAALETAILTDTQVASKGGNQSTATAKGSIVVTPIVYQCPSNDCTGAHGPLVDVTTLGATVIPNKVTFNERVQTLTANLLGLNCTANLTTGVVTCTDPEVIDLVLSTTSAHSFNFLVSGLAAGVYQIQLGVAVSTAATADSLQAGARAKVAVAAGSLVDMIVQAETPFTTISICNPTGTAAGSVNSCGP